MFYKHKEEYKCQKQKKVWWVTPILEYDKDGNATAFGYPEAVVTSRKKARDIKITLDSMDNIPAGAPERRVVLSQILRGW